MAQYPDLQLHIAGEWKSAEGEPVLTVEGPVRGLVAWLSGRATGDGLQVRRDGVQVTDPRTALPQLPAMS